MVIKGFVDSHDVEHALLVLQDMASAGEAPDEIVFTQLLHGCFHVPSLELGERIFADMLAADVRPSHYTLTAMLKLYGRCGIQEKAYELVAIWETKYRGTPSVIHFTCLVSGCLRSKKYAH